MSPYYIHPPPFTRVALWRWLKSAEFKPIKLAVVQLPRGACRICMCLAWPEDDHCPCSWPLSLQQSSVESMRPSLSHIFILWQLSGITSRLTCLRGKLSVFCVRPAVYKSRLLFSLEQKLSSFWIASTLLAHSLPIAYSLQDQSYLPASLWSDHGETIPFPRSCRAPWVEVLSPD